MSAPESVGPTAPRRGRPARRVGYLEVAILAGTAAMLLQKALAGALVLYLHPRYTWLVIASGVVLLLASGARLLQVCAGTAAPARRRDGYLVLARPILLGLLVPARPLAWGAAAPAAPSLGDTSFTAPAPTGDTRDWNIYQWRLALRSSEAVLPDLQGREADVVGFARHNPRYGFDGFFAARFVIVHCVVDAVASNLPVVWPDGGTIPP